MYGNDGQRTEGGRSAKRPRRLLKFQNFLMVCALHTMYFIITSDLLCIYVFVLLGTETWK